MTGMTDLICSACLTHYPEVARSVGLDPLSKLEAIVDVPLKVELSFWLGTYRTFTGTTGRRHVFGL
jgi:hypothetical protein